MTTILVTGAHGFVGKNLVPELQRLGHHVRCAVWKKIPGISAEQIEINKIESQANWSEALTDVEIVIHLAAKVHQVKKQGNSSIDEYCKINSIATKHFAEQAAGLKVRRFIFLSSIKVNGEYTPKGHSFSENCQENPEDPYAKSKLLAEQYLQEISQNTGMEIVILRPPLVYGPGVKANFLSMMTLVAKGWPLPFKRVTNQRSLLYIDNLVSAICAVLTNPLAANQLFTVADNEAWSLPGLIDEIALTMERKSRVFAVPVRGLSLLLNLIGLKRMNTRLFESLLVNNDKIKAQLAWQPPVKAAEGIRNTVHWYQHEINR